MDLLEKFKMTDFLNLAGSKRGMFAIDPTNGQCGYKDHGAVFLVPDEGIRELYDVAMEGAKLGLEYQNLARRKYEVDDRWLEGAIIRKYDTPDPVEDGES